MSILVEDDFEAGGIVAVARVEGVARGLVQVNVNARGVVDEVQVVALNGLRVEGQRVGAVLCVGEVQRHHLGVAGVGKGIILITHGNEELGRVGVEDELAAATAFARLHIHSVSQRVIGAMTMSCLLGPS